MGADRGCIWGLVAAKRGLIAVWGLIAAVYGG